MEDNEDRRGAGEGTERVKGGGEAVTVTTGVPPDTPQRRNLPDSRGAASRPTALLPSTMFSVLFATAASSRWVHIVYCC